MRIIPIDDDTCVKFDYEKKIYIIENKKTTTTRTSAVNTKYVLDIVAPDNTITVEDLNNLATEIIEITDIYYTWEDTGSYIKTVQFDDYAQYPLTVDAERKKLYIMNSPVIFDLELNVEIRHRLEQTRAFYLDTLGLNINLRELRALYCTLTNYVYNEHDLVHPYTYTPNCYNVIEEVGTEEDNTYSLIYSDTLKLHDYLHRAKADYTCTLNPNKQYTKTKLADILRIEGNAITLSTTVPTEIHVGSKITLTNTATTVDTTTYSADGTYTVKDTEANIIYTTENLPSNFAVEFPILNIVAYANPIQEISREKQCITLTNPATDFLVGDKIIVRGATVTTEYETLQLDGIYSIIGIEYNKVYVEELPLTNYTPTEPYTAYTYKPIPILSITSITNNILTVAEDIPTTLTVGTAVVETKQDDNMTDLQYATVTGIDQSSHTVVLDTAWEDNVQHPGVLNKPIPYPNVLTEVADSKNTEVLPNGDFMLDDQEQAIDYLKLLLPEQILPNYENLNNLGNFDNCGKAVSEYYIIHVEDIELTMTCLGLYSKNYKEQ